MRFAQAGADEVLGALSKIDLRRPVGEYLEAVFAAQLPSPAPAASETESFPAEPDRAKVDWELRAAGIAQDLEAFDAAEAESFYYLSSVEMQPILDAFQTATHGCVF